MDERMLAFFFSVFALSGNIITAISAKLKIQIKKKKMPLRAHRTRCWTVAV